MLENTRPLSALNGKSKPLPSGGRALHAFGWNDLTVRINAARDLREVLRQDLVLGTASFTDAAAGYFAKTTDDFEQEKQVVNHDALEGCKSSGGIGEDPTDTDGIELPSASPNEGDREQ